MTAQIAEDLILSVPSAALARRAPEEWAEFMKAFALYVEKQRDHLQMATLEELQRTQGRAQASHQLLSLFRDAVKAADRISERAGRR